MHADTKRQEEQKRGEKAKAKRKRDYVRRQTMQGDQDTGAVGQFKSPVEVFVPACASVRLPV